MLKRIFLGLLSFLTCLSMMLSACSQDWDISSSGLGDEASSSPGSSEDIIKGGGVFDSQNNDSESSENQTASSSAGKYDADAPPPKITDPIMGSAWREFTKAPIQNSLGDRSAEAYLAVILQFNVEGSYPCRYTPTCGGTSDTRCNIFASDVMNAMGAPLPTKGDLGKGHGDSKNSDPMPANAKDTYAWLEQEKDGWRKLDPNNPSDWASLMKHVAAGKPALASHPDHVAVIRPDQPSDLAVGNTGGLHIAQAGAYNSNNTIAKNAFANRVIDIYIHD